MSSPESDATFRASPTVSPDRQLINLRVEAPSVVFVVPVPLWGGREALLFTPLDRLLPHLRTDVPLNLAFQIGRLTPQTARERVAKHET